MITSWLFDAIGTKWQIDLYGNAPDNLKHRLMSRIDEFDMTYSRFRADSSVTTWQTPGEYLMPPDGFKLFGFYKKIYDATNGKVTPLIGKVMSDAGYDANYTLIRKALHQPPGWTQALDFDHEKLTILQPVLLDFGAAGKGYLVDILADIIRENPEIISFVINAGGDIHRWSQEVIDTPIQIGLENPVNSSQVVGIAALTSGSLCASSGSQRKWGNIHHIIDPKKLESPQDVLATWVKAETTMIADGLSTALFFVEPQELREFNFDYAVLREGMQLVYSASMLEEVF